MGENAGDGGPSVSEPAAKRRKVVKAMDVSSGPTMRKRQHHKQSSKAGLSGGPVNEAE